MHLGQELRLVDQVQLEDQAQDLQTVCHLLPPVHDGGHLSGSPDTLPK